MNEHTLGSNCDLLKVGLKIHIGQSKIPSPAESVSQVDALPVEQLSPELLTVTANSETHDGQRTITLTSLPEAGHRRVSFKVTVEDAERVRVTWPFKPQGQSLITLLLYSGSRDGIYGSVSVSRFGAGLPEVLADGAAQNATLIKDTDGWYRLTFEFEPTSDQANTQVIVYPTGVATVIEAPNELVTAAPTAVAF